MIALVKMSVKLLLRNKGFLFFLIVFFRINFIVKKSINNPIRNRQIIVYNSGETVANFHNG